MEAVQMPSRVALSLVLALIVGISCKTASVHSDALGFFKIPPLSSLDAGCRLRDQYVGLPGVLREALVMRCGNAEFVVREPDNMIGHVHIRTPAQALEFVRFFSSPDSYGYFSLGGMVEVVPSTDEGEFNGVPPAVFARYFKPASVTEHDSSCRFDGALDCGRCFEIERPVVLLDKRVLEFGQWVCESGLTLDLERKVVIENAETIGILHFGDI
jgi:hypothetical protein